MVKTLFPFSTATGRCTNYFARMCIFLAFLLCVNANAYSQCTVPTALTASPVTSFDVTLSWGAGTGAIMYEYAVTTSPFPPLPAGL